MSDNTAPPQWDIGLEQSVALAKTIQLADSINVVKSHSKKLNDVNKAVADSTTPHGSLLKPRNDPIGVHATSTNERICVQDILLSCNDFNHNEVLNKIITVFR